VANRHLFEKVRWTPQGSLPKRSQMVDACGSDFPAVVGINPRNIPMYVVSQSIGWLDESHRGDDIDSKFKSGLKFEIPKSVPPPPAPTIDLGAAGHRPVDGRPPFRRNQQTFE
jgi:hypothetical protein